MREISALFILPILSGLIILLFKHRGIRWFMALCVSLFCLLTAGQVFFSRAFPEAIEFPLIGSYSLFFGLNNLSAIILSFINLFGFLICLYSFSYAEDNRPYFSYLLWLIAFSNLVLLSNDFISFIFGWGSTLILLYLLLNLGSGESAKRAISVLGFADLALMLGACLYIAATGNLRMPHQFPLTVNNPLLWLSFLTMLSGALAKAGCAPFHTWIPAASTDAPIPVMAILPASLDKLLGIYLLARICVDFFVLNNIALGILLVTGGITIIFAVTMALIQHDLRMLLSYHAISQVGYMVLGFGTGLPIGIAGGLFHMINHAIYKSGLFLVAGSVKKQKRTTELDELGGLSAYMPVTFITGVIFALSISGVPPLNGFASKWVLYQGTVMGLYAASSMGLKCVFIFALVAAMFGSALTLASFIKFIHAVFLGQRQGAEDGKTTEPPFNMVFSQIALALLCVVLGLFPSFFVSRFLAFVTPWLSVESAGIGNWDSIFAFVFLLSGLGLGLIFWLNSSRLRKWRKDTAFIGGETTDLKPTFPATEFYRTVESVGLLRGFYALMRWQALDLYNLLRNFAGIIARILYWIIDRLVYALTNAAGYLVLGASWFFRRLHTGVLDWYLAWSLLGLLLMFLIIMKW